MNRIARATAVLCLSLSATMAVAQDLDDDGCIDSVLVSTSVCQHPLASVHATSSAGSGSTIGAYANIGPGIQIGSTVFVGSRATMAGTFLLPGPLTIGDGTTLGRRVTLGTDVIVGADVTLARGVSVGASGNIGAGSTLGYGSTLGDDVTLDPGATIGALVTVGDNATVGSSAILARGVTIATSDASNPAVIEGIIGPDVTIGKNVDIGAGVRIRKGAIIGDNVTIHDGARIGRDVNIGEGSVVGLNSRVGAQSILEAYAAIEQDEVIPRGTTVEGGPPDVNPPGTTLIASSAFTDPDPPAGWTQCAGYTNTAGDDVSDTVLDACMPLTQLRIRLYDDEGTLIDDLYGSGHNRSTFPNWSYLTTNRVTVVRTLYPGNSGLFSGNPFQANHHPYYPMFSTGHGGPAIVPAHNNDTAEITTGTSNLSLGLLNYSVAIFN